LEHRLEALEIYVSKGTDGLFTVHTEEEPFFCFVRKDFNDLNTIVAGTLESYIRNFFDCDSVEVQANNRRERRNSSGVPGAQFCRGKYKAQLRINGRTIHLGVFGTPEEASAAYRLAKLNHEQEAVV
jgi:hypothetical protein